MQIVDITQIIASSTQVVTTGTGYLFQTVWAFLPLILLVAIPLGALFGAYYWFKHRAGRV